MTSEDPSSSPNHAQFESWNAAAGQTWALLHEQLDRQIAPLGEPALSALALASGEAALDVGCGCGQTTLDMAVRVGPEGVVVGVDISAPMLAIARERALPSGAARTYFRQVDAQTQDLGAAVFDAVYSRFGVMFFSDPVAAFANMRRSLKFGGRLGFACWRPLAANPWMLEPLEAARPFLPPATAPDPAAPGPFALADDGRIRSILSAAGYRNIEIEAFSTQIGSGDLEESVRVALRVGPLGLALRENPSSKELVADAVRAVLAKHLTPSGVSMPASAWIVKARNVAQAAAASRS